MWLVVNCKLGVWDTKLVPSEEEDKREGGGREKMGRNRGQGRGRGNFFS